jgi:nitrate reductase gamma subunit
MNLLPQLITYVCVLVFVAAIIVRFQRIQSYPIHLRWELYPVPHEGKRAEHGGSRYEELDWWTKERHRDRVMQCKYMLQEMVFIKALKENNPKLWCFSFPFHFGLYVIAAFAALLVASAALGLAGVRVGPGVEGALTAIGLGGMVLTILGGLGLLAMRLTDAEMTPYTNPSHIFNLLLIVATLVLMVLALWQAGWSAGPLLVYVASLLTLSPASSPTAPLITPAVIAASLLLAYITLTHMSHFFVKWFTWDKIRWDDEPNVKGGRIEKMIEQALMYPVSWSADHIRGNGKKTWADVATEEWKSK